MIKKRIIPFFVLMFYKSALHNSRRGGRHIRIICDLELGARAEFADRHQKHGDGSTAHFAFALLGCEHLRELVGESREVLHALREVPQFDVAAGLQVIVMSRFFR